MQWFIEKEVSTTDYSAAPRSCWKSKLTRPAIKFCAMRLRGYVPDIEATGRSHYLGAILWCSICDMPLSPIQFYFIFAYLEVLMTRRIVSYVLMVLSFVVLNLVLRLVSFVTFPCHLLLVIEAVCICSVQLTSIAYSVTGNIPSYYYAVFVVVAVDCFVVLFQFTAI